MKLFSSSWMLLISVIFYLIGAFLIPKETIESLGDSDIIERQEYRFLDTDINSIQEEENSFILSSFYFYQVILLIFLSNRALQTPSYQGLIRPQL